MQLFFKMRMYCINLHNHQSGSSTCSSRYSNTSGHSLTIHNDGESDEENGDDGSYVEDDETQSCSDVFSTGSNESIAINVSIKQFPMNLIFLEKMESTLDNYMMNNDISIKEWKSILFQIIAQTIRIPEDVLIFTHNDLHTNNIMYNTTEKRFIIYHIDGTYYKVPTHGKLYKIIDFGRAIYKFNGKRYCSDSYATTWRCAYTIQL